MDTNNRIQHNRSNKASILTAVSVLCVISILLAVLSGCSSAASSNANALPQPTLDELLAEINEEHGNIQRSNQDPTPYLRTSIDEETSRELLEKYQNSNAGANFDANVVLTAEQAAEDTNYMFDALYSLYSLYDYFGGQEVFEAARERALTEIAQRDTVTGEELQNILLGQLSFIEDGHFSINFRSPARTKIPFFFREKIFLKTDKGYHTVDGKTVEAVDGYLDLDDLFKRSISPDGELVYYPVILQECEFMDALLNEQTCDDTLTVRYSDGTTEALTAEPYQVYCESMSMNNEPACEMHTTDDIPVMQFSHFKKFTQPELEELLAMAGEISDVSPSILDLRSNGGGDSSCMDKFISAYTGRRSAIHSNAQWYNVYSGMLLSSNAGASVQGQLHSNDDVRIVLVGKYSASCTELLLDSLQSFENVLVIGENTCGAMITAIKAIELPNSKSRVQFGFDNITLSKGGPEHFQELRGLYPDIWVPAGEAEELAAKLINNLAQ